MGHRSIFSFEESGHVYKAPAIKQNIPEDQNPPYHAVETFNVANFALCNMIFHVHYSAATHSRRTFASISNNYVYNTHTL